MSLLCSRQCEFQVERLLLLLVLRLTCVYLLLPLSEVRQLITRSRAIAWTRSARKKAWSKSFCSAPSYKIDSIHMCILTKNPNRIKHHPNFQ